MNSTLSKRDGRNVLFILPLRKDRCIDGLTDVSEAVASFNSLSPRYAFVIPHPV